MKATTITVAALSALAAVDLVKGGISTREDALKKLEDLGDFARHYKPGDLEALQKKMIPVFALPMLYQFDAVHSWVKKHRGVTDELDSKQAFALFFDCAALRNCDNLTERQKLESKSNSSGSTVNEKPEHGLHKRFPWFIIHILVAIERAIQGYASWLHTLNHMDGTLQMYWDAFTWIGGNAQELADKLQETWHADMQSSFLLCDEQVKCTDKLIQKAYSKTSSVKKTWEKMTFLEKAAIIYALGHEEYLRYPDPFRPPYKDVNITEWRADARALILPVINGVGKDNARLVFEAAAWFAGYDGVDVWYFRQFLRKNGQFQTLGWPKKAKENFGKCGRCLDL